MSATLCPWCQAPRAEGPACPRCGANYAKAEAIKQQGRAVAMPVPAPAPAEPVFQSKTQGLQPLSEYVDPDAAIDTQAEWKLCLVAVPAALAAGLLLHALVPAFVRIIP